MIRSYNITVKSRQDTDILQMDYVGSVTQAKGEPIEHPADLWGGPSENTHWQHCAGLMAKQSLAHMFQDIFRKC